MKFLSLVCTENDTTDEQNTVVAREIFPWVQGTIDRRINITGKPLDSPETARTVRVRDRETLISDGPFVDTKEFLGGFDLLSCETFDAAVGWAAKHPSRALTRSRCAASSTSLTAIRPWAPRP